MDPKLVEFLLGLVEHVPQLTADAVKEAATIAHGEGGIGKVVAAARGLAEFVEDAFGEDHPNTTSKPAA